MIFDMRIGFELFDPDNRLIVRKERLNSDTYLHDRPFELKHFQTYELV